jgi:protein-disulfide isomerase
MTRDTVPPMTRRERRAQARLERPAGPRGRQSRRQAPRPVWQSPAVMVTVAAVVIGIAIIAFARPGAPSNEGELNVPATSYSAELTDGETLGSSSAPVVLQLYSDFQCPACKVFVTQQLPSLVNEFVKPGILRIEARDLDFLGSGRPNESQELAAGAACAAEQDRYWQFHDYVFWNQLRENQGDYTSGFITRIADASGVDRTAWDACFAREDVRPPIVARTSAATADGISSTPTLVVNGQRMVGVPKYDDLATLIRQQAASPAPSTAPTAP